MPDRPNLFSSQTGVFSSTNPVLWTFGFQADQFRMRNRSARSVFVSFLSTAASTSDYEVLSSETLVLGPAAGPTGHRYPSLALATTSTTTSVAATAVDILAVG